MFEFNIDLSGIEQAFAEAPGRFADALARGMQLSGQVLVREAKQRAPVSPNGGRLRRSIKSEMTSDADDLVMRVGTNVHYAIHVEYGHRTRGGKSYVPGRYFLKGSLDSQRGNVLRVIARALTGEVVR